MSPYKTPAASLTLACVNVERSKHLPKLLPFLADVDADVLCLQELIADDIPAFRRHLGYTQLLYAPMARHSAEGVTRPYGVGILSRLPMVRTDVLRYAGHGTGDDVFDVTSMHSKVRTCRYVVAVAEFIVQGQAFAIATTHFPWTPDASATDFQRDACDSLVAQLGRRDLVLCGDFNAPRGGEIYGRLAATWRDDIPAHYTSSIDPELHRAGALDLLVDGVFSAPGYRLSDVALHTGVSDHRAITCVVHADMRTHAGPQAGATAGPAAE